MKKRTQYSQINSLIDNYLIIVTAKGILPAFFKANLRSYLDYLFRDVSFIGKSMLDIGGGSGLLSFYGAIMGAKEVICLEPEAEGSIKGIRDRFKHLQSALSLNSVRAQPIRFQDFDTGDKTFDIILLHNSINHLDEEACMKLQYDSGAREKYRLIFQKLSKLAAPGAKLIIADSSRYNFFASLGIRNPFAPTIEWHKHQPPEFWSKCLSAYGFINPEIRWTSFGILGRIGKLLFGNRFASYFLTSHFILTMDKRRNLIPE